MIDREYMTNIQRLRQSFASGLFDADALLLTSKISRTFACGFASSAGMLLISPYKCTFITDFRYYEAALADLSGIEVIRIERGENYTDLLNVVFERDNIRSVCVEDTSLTVAEYDKFVQAFNVDLRHAGKGVLYLRASKNPYELNCMQKAQDIADRVFLDLLPRIKPGMSEKQLEAELIYLIYTHGSDGLSFDPIVVSGPNTSLPHGRAGSRVIREYDFVTFDFGAIYRGYCSDMTRTICIGNPSEKMKEIYSIVLEANLLGLENARSGVLWRDVDGAARAFITEKGYGNFFGHGLGHGLGLEVHESLDFNAETPGMTPENGVVSVEPGIYIPGEFGVRIEDCVILKPYGNINMAHSTKELLVIK